MGFVYFALIYKWLSDQITHFGLDLMSNVMVWASGIALVLVTLWIMIQGYRMITGQSRESMMALVMNMTRVVIIVAAATTMSMFGADLHRFLTTDLGTEVNQLVTGNSNPPAETIDKTLALTQVALAAIDAVQVTDGDTDISNTKAHALIMAGFGTASPPMAAAAMLLLYQFTLAIFIGLGPLFILCLIFDQTKSLFQRWLLYGIGTIFSMAVLAFVTTLTLDLTLRVASALWASNAINNMTGLGAEGISSLALQQGGLGLLMTVLIVSVPPLAAMFFQGTVGNFLTYSAFGMGGGNSLGPQGQPPGSYGSGGSHHASATQTNSGQRAADGAYANPSLGRMTGQASTVQPDVTKTTN